MLAGGSRQRHRQGTKMRQLSSMTATQFCAGTECNLRRCNACRNHCKCGYRWQQTAAQAGQAVEAAEQLERAASAAAQAAAAASFAAEAQAEKLTGVVKQLQVRLHLGRKRENKETSIAKKHTE